jgi:DNA-binding SARP family transcriptional activator
VEIRILGPVEVLVGGQRLPLRGQRARVVLAVLALDANRVVPMERLIEALWDYDPPATARAQVQICISAIRRSLTDAGMTGRVRTCSPGYVLAARPGELDVTVFEEQVGRARRLAADGRTADAAETLRDGLALWRGRALAGMSGRLIESRALRLDDQRLTAIAERIRLDLALGRNAEVVGELLDLLAEHPLREGLYANLMLALYRSGRQGEALETYRRARRALVEELGIEPGEELRQLERAILAGNVDLAPPGGRAATPALAPVAVPRQLPCDIADFTARTDDIAHVHATLVGGVSPDGTGGRPALAIAAIAGPGGVGKSALAVHVAHEVREHFPGGQLYANLAGAGDRPVPVAEVLARFLRALDVPGPALPTGVDELAETYRNLVAERRVLVVLDGAVSEAQVLPLLPGSPHCGVIVTSRVRLTGLPGAHHVHLDVLDTASGVALLQKILGPRLLTELNAAVRLTKLCGGLPLALRIVGARLASRPHWRLSAMADRLRDQTRRLDELEHGELGVRASIAMTYVALRPPAKRLLRQLAALDVPDFASWVAAALLDVDLDEAEERLDQLVDVHMLEVVTDEQATSVRYRFHDLIRVFALERTADGEVDPGLTPSVHRALSAWLTLAEEAHRREYGGDYTIVHGNHPRTPLPAEVTAQLLDQPLSWLEAERAAMIAAFRQAVRSGLDELCWDLALTAVTLFEAKSYLNDWRETAELALVATRRAGNRRGVAAMLYSLGSLYLVEQRFPDAEALFAESLDGFAACGDRHGRALVLRNLAFLDRIRGSGELALNRYNEALVELRSVGDQVGVAHVLSNLASLLADAADLDGAQKLLDEALSLSQLAGSRRMEAQVLYRLGEVNLRQGEIEAASRAFHSVLRSARDTGDRVGEAYALLGLSTVQRRLGRYTQAETSLTQVLPLAATIRDRLVEARVLHALGELYLERGRLDEAEQRLTEAHDLLRDIGATLRQARVLISLGELHTARGDVRAAARTAITAATLLSGVDTVEARRLRAELAGCVIAA